MEHSTELEHRDDYATTVRLAADYSATEPDPGRVATYVVGLLKAYNVPRADRCRVSVTRPAHRHMVTSVRVQLPTGEQFAGYSITRN